MSGVNEEDLQVWDLSESSDHSQYKLSKLFTNYDMDSIMQYQAELGIRALNDFYNVAGFGDTLDLSATDKVALNILYSCQEMKKSLYEEFTLEETRRNYIELMQLKVNPNKKSER